jgi:hypothetical protein
MMKEEVGAIYTLTPIISEHNKRLSRLYWRAGMATRLELPLQDTLLVMFMMYCLCHELHILVQSAVYVKIYLANFSMHIFYFNLLTENYQGLILKILGT